MQRSLVNKMFNQSEFDVFVTITGFNHFPNTRRLYDGETVALRKEPQNDYDKFAIAVYGENGQIGYVANSVETIIKGALSAKQIYDLMEESARAVVIECSYHDALCRVEGIFDADKMIAKAFEYYNALDYNNALELFLILGKKYNSVLLLQYTADCYLKIGSFEAALLPLKSALLKEPENKITLMMYGSALESIGEYESAIEQYSKILDQKDNEEVEKALKRCKDKLK